MSQFNPNPNPNNSSNPYPQSSPTQPQVGQQPSYGQPLPQAPMQGYQNHQYSGGSVADTGSFGWAVLGFFIPIAGLVLWLVWKNTKPKTATQCRNGFIAGLVLTVAFYIFSFAIISSLSSGI